MNLWLLCSYYCVQPSDMALKDYGRLLLDGEVKVKHERASSQRYTSDQGDNL